MTTKQAILSSHKERLDSPTISGICTNIVAQTNKQVLYLSASAVLDANNRRLIVVKLKLIKNGGEGRDYEISWNPNPYMNFQQVNREVMNRAVLMLGGGGGKVYFTLTHAENWLPNYSGVELEPISADANPTFPALQQCVIDEAQNYLNRKEKYL